MDLRHAQVVLDIEEEPPLLAADAQPIGAARSARRGEGVLLQQVVNGDAALVLVVRAAPESGGRIQHDLDQPVRAGRVPVHVFTPTRRRA